MKKDVGGHIALNPWSYRSEVLGQRNDASKIILGQK
jgi:hypothetical protein